MAITNEIKGQVDAAVKVKDIKTAGKLLNAYKGSFSEYGFFHISCAEGLFDAAKLFLTIPKLDINWKTGKTKKTALILAAEQGQLEIVKLLLTRPGIDVNLADSNGNTALDLAKKAGRSDIADELSKHGAKAGANNAKAQQQAFDRMQASNRAVLIKANQPSDYEMRLENMTLEEAQAELQRLKSERAATIAEGEAKLKTQVAEIENKYAVKNKLRTEQYGRDLAAAFAEQARISPARV